MRVAADDRRIYPAVGVSQAGRDFFFVHSNVERAAQNLGLDVIWQTGVGLQIILPARDCLGLPGWIRLRDGATGLQENATGEQRQKAASAHCVHKHDGRLSHDSPKSEEFWN